MWAFSDVKKFSLVRMLSNIYSIKAFLERNEKIIYNRSQSKFRE